MEHAVSLYIHIPFCLSKCTYCDFYSIPCRSAGVPDSYVDAILREAAYRAEITHSTSWRTVYVGGGTPSLLTVAQTARLFSGLAGIAGGKLPAEVSVECNPSDVTPEKLAVLENSGVTRLSCGIQSFSGPVLKNVRRRSGTDDILRALACIRKNWHGLFSADMISALPGETEKSFISGLESLLDYTPGHISLYSLTIERGTPLGDEIASKSVQYDYDRADALWILGRDYLCARGYRQYEVSNFCIHGEECRHNMAYWNQEDYIGCGAGATGTLYGRNGALTIRETNTQDIAAYTGFWLHENGTAEAAVPSEKEYIRPETAGFEFFMMGLRTASGICRETYEEKFGTPFPQKAEKLFRDWQKTGRCTMYEKDSRHFYSLTGSGLLFLNEFLESL